jgi:hypothetical protein
MERCLCGNGPDAEQLNYEKRGDLTTTAIDRQGVRDCNRSGPGRPSDGPHRRGRQQA